MIFLEIVYNMYTYNIKEKSRTYADEEADEELKEDKRDEVVADQLEE